ncbi:hypothetical protein NHX12_019698 [Muraenolepis orangiensis]|uniref:PAS domain-containing protein n=1 Tax=Muraenolepis orangiensis TaxID=630683 RepID=A0A9Q0IWA0_9TELE|nr:hypothetical protein NHX12_019698 [Muraenolepis orangiensis]
MVVVAHALPPPTINEVRIDCQMFVTRVNMDLNIVYCENRISDYMDLTPADIVGRRCYQMIHAEDVDHIRHCHLDRDQREFRDVPVDLSQLPDLKTRTSETSETSDSESEAKDVSDNDHPRSGGKPAGQSETADRSKRQQQIGQSQLPPVAQEVRGQEDGDSCSHAESQESDDSLEASDGEPEEEQEEEGRGGGAAGGGGGARLAAMEAMDGLLGAGLRIKVERHPTRSSSSEEEEEDEEEEERSVKDGEEAGGLTSPGVELLKKRKRRRKQKWDRTRGRRPRLSAPVAHGDGAPSAEEEEQPVATPSSSFLLSSSCSSSAPPAAVLKIKTEMSEPINFDNDSSIWNFPPNREVGRHQEPFSIPPPGPFPSPADSLLSPPGPFPSPADSLLSPPAPEVGEAGRKPPHDAASAPSRGGAPSGSSSSSSDPLSPPLSSSSPRDKQQATPTGSSSSSSSSLLYSGELEALQRLQAGSVVLPLVQRVSGASPGPAGSAPSRVYTAGTIRYAPADAGLAPGGALLPNASFGLDPKGPVELLYRHVHRLNMTAAAAAASVGGAFGGGASPEADGGGARLPLTTNVFAAGEGLFSTLPFPVYSNGIHSSAQERKDD